MNPYLLANIIDVNQVRHGQHHDAGLGKGDDIVGFIQTVSIYRPTL